MLAAVKTTAYQQFDASDLYIERKFTLRNWDKLNPRKAGDVAPDFVFEKDNNRWQQFFNGIETHGPVLLRELLNKTLVVSFYSNQWQAHGLDMLLHLNSLQSEIRAKNASLLIISAEKERRLEKTAWDNSLSLNFYIDIQKEIAEKFGVFSENDPVWNRFSGIDINVPLLATYVIAPYGKILYSHIDWDCSKAFPSKEIIEAII